MIYIEKDTTNQFAVEATCGLPQADNLFLIMGILWEGEIDKQWRVIELEDISPVECRYNLFEITESSMGTDAIWCLLGEEVRLELGQYQYYIWGSPEPWIEGSPGYDGKEPPAKLSGAIANGRLIVVGEIETPYDSIIPNTILPSVYD